jgi:hypothetical protein
MGGLPTPLRIVEVLPESLGVAQLEAESLQPRESLRSIHGRIPGSATRAVQRSAATLDRD